VTQDVTTADPTGAPERASINALAVLCGVPVLVLILDQWSKQAAIDHLLGGAVYLTLTRNNGAAYSIGGDFTAVFPIIAIVVVGGIIWLSRRLRSVPWGLAFGLIIGGALGNLIDRLFREPGVLRGEVVDMISLFDRNGHFFPPGAIFNLADSALFCGVVLAILLELTGRRRDGSRRLPDPSPDAGSGHGSDDG
jgi:signal peptidase II